MRKRFSSTSLIVIAIICCFFFQTSAYSLLNSALLITGNAIARIHNNVRINNFKIHEVSDGVISSYEEFSKTNTNSNVTLPNSDSYIIYKLDIGNYETVEMQLSNITGLSSNLTYELIDYSLHDMICDVTNKCTSGAEMTLYLKIKYTSYDSAKTNYNVNLNYEFNEFSNVLMVGSEFKSTIPPNATQLVFTDEKPAQGTVLTDVSYNKDMGVVGYLDGTTYKISTRRTGIKAEANVDSSYMFSETALTDIDLSNLNTTNVNTMSAMFLNDSNLINITFGDSFNTSKVTDMSQMFHGCSLIVNLDFSNFDTSKCTDFSSFLRGCVMLETADVSCFDTSNVKTFYSMFRDCKKLSVINVCNFDTSKSASFQSMFSGCNFVEILDVSGFNTSSLKNIHGMFVDCYNVKQLDVSKFNVSGVTNFSSMFQYCISLETVDLSNWNTSNVTSMYAMFSHCSSLLSLDLSSFDVSNVTDVSWMFQGCENLKYLNVDNWSFEKSVSFAGMFHFLKCVEELDLSSWVASDVIDAHNMFNNCRTITKIDLTGLNFQNVLDLSGMFNNDGQLQKIYVNDEWNISDGVLSEDMFYNCFKLPNFDSNYLDGTKAYIGEGGYLSSKIKDVTIAGVVYQFEEDMTWGEWLDSEYNTAGFVTDGEYVIFADNGCTSVRYDPNNYASLITDTIDYNKEYFKRSNGCISGCFGGCN